VLNVGVRMSPDEPCFKDGKQKTGGNPTQQSTDH
jgi:hypothetical protein